MLTSNRSYAYAVQTSPPLRLRRRPPHRPTRHRFHCRAHCASMTVPAQSLGYHTPEAYWGPGRFASQNFQLPPQPIVEKGLTATREIPSTHGVCVTNPQPRAATTPASRFSARASLHPTAPSAIDLPSESVVLNTDPGAHYEQEVVQRLCLDRCAVRRVRATR